MIFTVCTILKLKISEGVFVLPISEKFTDFIVKIVDYVSHSTLQVFKFAYFVAKIGVFTPIQRLLCKVDNTCLFAQSTVRDCPFQ